MKINLLIGLVLASSLSGCATHDEFLTAPIAIPVQPSTDLQSKIYQLDMLLARPDISKKDKKNYLIEQGIYYDSFGLYDLAYVKYAQSLEIEQDYKIYNAIGLYYLLNQQFDSAFEAYDFALAVNPSDEYALFNRAVALYYAERYQLAFDDIQSSFEQNSDDPFRLLWRYIIQYKILPEQALSELVSHYNQAPDKNMWGWQLVGMMAGQIKSEEVLSDLIEQASSNRDTAMKLSEFYFYLAKYHQYKGDDLSAVNLYKLSLSQNIYEYIEHKYSLIELKRILVKLSKKEITNSSEKPADE